MQITQKITYILIVCFITCISCDQQYNNFSKVTQQFQDSVKNEQTYCLYNSTLKSLNLNNDNTFNQFVDNIKKVKVVSYNKSSDSTKKIDVKKLSDDIKSENYTELFRLRQKQKDIRVFILKKGEETKKLYGIVSDSSQIILIDLVGNIPLNKISALATGNINLSGLNSIFNFKRSNSNKRKQQ